MTRVKCNATVNVGTNAERVLCPAAYKTGITAYIQGKKPLR